MKYEYKMLKDIELANSKSMEDSINEFAREGWEPILMSCYSEAMATHPLPPRRELLLRRRLKKD